MASMAEALAAQGSRPVTSMILGTVTAAPGTGVVTVTVGGTSVVLPHLRGYAPAVNDAVVILRQGARQYVVAAVTNPADPIAARSPAPAPSQSPPTDTNPAPVQQDHTVTFLATAHGCYRGSGWRTDDVRPHQGDYGGFGVNTGAWFYGNQVRAALGGARVTGAAFFYHRIAGGDFAAQPLTLWTMAHQSQPAGAPTRQSTSFTCAAKAVSTSGWVSLPTWFVQRMSDGTAFSIACYVATTTPYVQCAGFGEDRNSGALSITYAS